ncbi:MAG: AbrB/MazE/SpoVT family DNA-binding domain-containing protein [Candidatus Hodarchaeota archaeon]
MRIKVKLHASQLYIPKDFLQKLSLGKESEVYLELDEKGQFLLIKPENQGKVPKEWILNATENVPATIPGDSEEDEREYGYDDI